MNHKEEARLADNIKAKSIPTDYDVNDLDVFHNQVLAARFDDDFNRIFGEKNEQRGKSRGDGTCGTA